MEEVTAPAIDEPKEAAVVHEEANNEAVQAPAEEPVNATEKPAATEQAVEEEKLAFNEENKEKKTRRDD